MRYQTARDRFEVRIMLYVTFFFIMLGATAFIRPAPSKCATPNTAREWTRQRAFLKAAKDARIQGAAKLGDAAMVAERIVNRAETLHMVDSTFRVRMSAAISADAATGCR